MRRALSVGLVCLLVVGCGAYVGDEDRGSKGGGETAPSGPGGSGSTTTAPSSPSPSGAPAGTAAECGFSPANGIGCENAGPKVDVETACEDLVIDTTAGKFACGTTVPSKLIDQGPSKPKIRVFYLTGFHLGRDKKIIVNGDNALAIVSRGDVVIEGVIEASAKNRSCTPGPGGYRGGQGADPKGERGSGPGGGEGASGYAGAGGGSYGGKGGAGGDYSGAESGAAAGQTYGEATLVPLLGGSGGGADDNCGGGGGGAVQLVSSTSILIAQGAGINVGGASSYGWHSGGGSGGAILVQAPTVTIDGTLAANGGGGSYGCGGELSGNPACAEDSYGPGGVGSSAISGDAASGGSSTSGGGGGGGGAGRIRIDSKTGVANISGVISPGLSTGLASQGKL